jgi:biotin operon repressor
VSTTVSRPAPPRPDEAPADCHHSKQPFDAAFRCINERRDIGAAAKLVHAHLVTIHRTGRDETQAEIGEAVGMSRHQVWRAICELVAAGLVQTIRYGLGRPNGYVLLGVDRETLDGKGGRATASRPSGGSVAGQVRTPARAVHHSKKTMKNTDTICEKTNYLETRDHGGTDYTMTRYGPLRPRG